MGFKAAVLGSGFGIIINFLMSQSLNYDIEILIMMQNGQPRTVGLKPMEMDMWTG